MSATPSSLDVLASRCGKSWLNLQASRQQARHTREQIAKVLSDERLVSPDMSLVVFGSLARDEWTQGSDVDWTLLVDGQADPTHLDVKQAIVRRLQAEAYKDPGGTAMFGGLTFSHELIHRIGGEYDSNRNTTQRILLLLESECIGKERGARDRVVRQLLKRYIEEDYDYRKSEDMTPQIPRFMLNDVVRYWRTLAVDFAAKRRERQGQGWALRNFKLRMSRKLIFAAGLAACVSCKLQPPERLQSGIRSGDYCSEMTAYLFDLMNHTPLEILARTVLAFDAHDAACTIYEAYDAFLGILADTGKRQALETLSPHDAFSDELFQHAREIGTRFQDGLTRLFFHTNPQLTADTQRYGVF